MEGQFEISTKLVFNDIVHIIKQKNKRIRPPKTDKNKDIDEGNKNNSDKDESSNEEINNIKQLFLYLKLYGLI